MQVSSKTGTKRKAAAREPDIDQDEPASEDESAAPKPTKRLKVAESATATAKTKTTTTSRSQQENSAPAAKARPTTSAPPQKTAQVIQDANGMTYPVTFQDDVDDEDVNDEDVDDEDATMADAPVAVTPPAAAGPVSPQHFATVTSTGPTLVQSVNHATAPAIPNAAAATGNMPQPAVGQLAIGGSGRGTVFRSALPPLFTPWTFSYAQGRKTFSIETAVTMDWSTLTHVDVKDRIIYELRAPWNANPISWSGLVTKYEELYNAHYSLEGMRKNFGRANKAVYAATGTYFVGSSVGLSSFGIPVDKDMTAALQNAGHIAKPMRKSKKASSMGSQSKLDLQFGGKATRLVIQQPGTTFYADRYIPKEMAKEFGIRDCILQASTKTFDRWFSCVAFGPYHKFPKRLYKLKKLSPGTLIYQDEGVPPVTMQDFLETYAFSKAMGTCNVSDMILDEVAKVLKREKSTYVKYKHGATCTRDPNDVFRYLDLQPADIGRLWQRTQPNDPLRALFVDLWAHNPAAIGQQTNKPDCHTAAEAVRIHMSFVRNVQRYDVVEDFASALTPDAVCQTYHSHGTSKPCYKSAPASTKAINFLNDELRDPQIVFIDDVPHTIYNETGDRLDLVYLQGTRCGWDWDRIRSIKAWILVPMKGPQRRDIRPSFYYEDEKDKYDRYPSHPGYRNPKWTKPVPEEDAYMIDWVTERQNQVPRAARKVQHPKKEAQGDVTFELEDESWYPPPDFVPDVKRQPDEEYHEHQRYRLWLWKKEGRSVPMKLCKRWRPWCRTLPGGQDTFADRADAKPRYRKRIMSQYKFTSSEDVVMGDDGEEEGGEVEVEDDRDEGVEEGGEEVGELEIVEEE